MKKQSTKTLKRIKILTGLFMIGLFVSGLTCFPIPQVIDRVEVFYSHVGSAPPVFVQTVMDGVSETYTSHPFLFYGTDWLGFAHILFALLFYGVYRDPLRNIWITQFGLIACIAIFPLAFGVGPLREIPFWWQCIDASFGVIGLLVMVPVYRMTLQLSLAGRDTNFSYSG